MAGFDKSLLQVAANQPAVNWSNNTTAASVSNVRVVVFVSYYYTSLAPSGCTIGGQAATRDLRVSTTADRVDIYSYPFAGGLASGSAIVIQATGTYFNGGVLVGAVALTGVDMTAGGGVAGVGSTTTLPNPATNWGSGTASAGGGIGFGGAGNECAVTSETATASTGVLVHHTWNSDSQQGFATAYVAGSGTSVGGTFASASTSTTGGIVTYADSGAGPALPPDLIMAPPDSY